MLVVKAIAVCVGYDVLSRRMRVEIRYLALVHYGLILSLFPGRVGSVTSVAIIKVRSDSNAKEKSNEPLNDLQPFNIQSTQEKPHFK